MTKVPRRHDSNLLSAYLADVKGHAPLEPDEERRLALRHREEGDELAAHTLIASNLRHVVAVVWEYRGYGLPIVDLIREGNRGLGRAVQTFDPLLGRRLLSYAVWWIRSCIANHVLQHWADVRAGSPRAQRSLFFALGKARREIERMTGASMPKPRRPDSSRPPPLPRRDADPLRPPSPRRKPLPAALHPEDEAQREARAYLAVQARKTLERLGPRERFIFENRVRADRPMTYSELGRRFGFSSERARQLHARARESINAALRAAAADLGGSSAEAAAVVF